MVGFYRQLVLTAYNIAENIKKERNISKYFLRLCEVLFKSFPGSFAGTARL
jgi:hypothetical protein